MAVHRARGGEPLGNYGFHAKLRKRQKNFAGKKLVGIVLADADLWNLDFSGAVVSGLTLTRGTLRQCTFDDAKFTAFEADGTRFVESSFDRAVMDACHLRNADMVASTARASSFKRASLEGVTFSGVNLSGALFTAAHFSSVTWADSSVAGIDVRGATFHDSDIRCLCDAVVRLVQESTFDWRTICKSLLSNRLVPTLVASGMPEVMATYLVDAARTLDPLTLFRLMRSTFISYGGPGARFARALRDRLHTNGVRTFFFELDAIPGERLHVVMRRGVNEHDRVILVCSAASLTRAGVKNEIQETLAREARDGGASYLIPVALDDFVFHWVDPLAHALRDRVVADFRGADKSDEKFDDGIVNLLRALRVT